LQKGIIFVLVAVILIGAAGLRLGFCKEEDATIDTIGIMDKLDQVLDNQEKILKRFDKIQQELGIIKIRASRGR
jgi:hypothetical protein